MTDPRFATPRAPHATKRWERPALSRIATKDAENSASPASADAVITFGS